MPALRREGAILHKIFYTLTVTICQKNCHQKMPPYQLVVWIDVVRGRRVAGAKARRARRAVPLRVGRAAILRMGALEGGGDLQKEMFVGDGAD
jgi:hypothetical protein